MLLATRGGGAAKAFGISKEVDLHIGTLSKAVGAHGGFVACRSELKTLLINRGRSYIFSTALPAPVVAAAIAALKVNEEVRINALRVNSTFGDTESNGFRVLHTVPSVPVIQRIPQEE